MSLKKHATNTNGIEGLTPAELENSQETGNIKFGKKYLFFNSFGQCCGSGLRIRIGSVFNGSLDPYPEPGQRHESADPDPYKDVTDPQHW
jgi:hypothetical protein